MDVDHVVAPRTGAAWRVEAGQHVRIVDVEGGQTGDLFLVPTDDVDDGLSNGRTFDYGGTISLTTGSMLYSRRSRPLAQIVADDVRRHDFLYTPCSREMYELQYDLADHPNCFDNLTGALRPFGVPDTTVTVAFNFFMNSRVDESGRLRIDPPLCRAGDALTIRLERDCFVAVTACPASVANGGGGGSPLGVTIGAAVGEDGTVEISFDGAVVLVTGGTKGAGRGIAERFAALGAMVAVSARNPVDDLPTTWTFEAADLRDGEAAFAMVDRVVERLGRLDVVVNNAGGAPPADTSTASPRFTERIVALNLLSAIYVAQRANEHMQRGDGGAIVNIGSVSANRPAPTAAAYGAAKAGLAAFTATAGQEWAPKVRVNCVTAGLIRTEQADLHYGDEASIAKVEQTIPIGRMASPSDVADACVYFASPLASYVTGADLVLHGGGDRPAFLDALRGAGS